MRSAHPQHTCLAGGIGRVYTHLHARNRAAARGHTAVARRHVGDEGAALGHAVDVGIREVYLVEELLYLAVQRRSAYYHLAHVAAEGKFKFGARTRQKACTEARSAQEYAHQALFEQRKHSRADDFLKDERHRSHQFRLYVGHGLHDHTRRRRARKERHVAARADGIEQLYGKAIHVAEGKHAHHGISRFEPAYGVPAELNVAEQRTVRQHHALAEAGGATGVVDEHHVGGGGAHVTHIIGRETLRVAATEKLVEARAGTSELVAAREQQREVAEAQRAHKVGHLLGVEVLPDGVVGQHEARVAVVDEVMDAVGLEVGQDGHGHTAVGDYGNHGHCPLRRVAATDGDALAGLQAGMFVEQVQLGYFACQVAVLKSDAAEVGERRALPIVADALFYKGYQ